MTEVIFLSIIVALLLYLVFSKKKLGATTSDSSQVEIELLQSENESLKSDISHYKSFEREAIEQKADKKNLERNILEKGEEIKDLHHKIEEKENQFRQLLQQKQYLEASNEKLREKISEHESELLSTKRELQKEFELLATKILDNKSERFIETNKSSLESILNPLKDHLQQFKGKVEEVYDKESQQRFSLEKEVKKLMELNHRISQDAQNLTHALKGESKVQGNWGEMILESILEKSGLRKGEEYFMEYVLRDQEGKRLRNEQGNSMRPDAVIVYPDQRKVIVDSKVSLNAYIRYCDCDNPEQQNRELNDHVTAIKNHVISLSKKSYDDYPDALDFVMMFIPNEPAYMAAIKHEPHLWQFAYDKRILILSPTNLITALKLVADLWKREHQNLNAIEIAERGGKLYDKFVGFIDNLQKVDKGLTQAQNSFQDAFKQLHTGKDNLVRQAEKLKDLGVKNRKKIPAQLISEESDSLLS
ncbi:MAG: DNA recombination protein RmuC [Prolixibacteraceae bacterium]|jgi:DNA recombination protein RmuC|nr:DNA recombination protein RmuC [Prolixibacteraceae bacterium]